MWLNLTNESTGDRGSVHPKPRRKSGNEDCNDAAITGIDCAVVETWTRPWLMSREY